MNHIGTQYIQTDRLTLRKFTMEDAKGMFDNWASDDDVTKYLTWQTHESVDVTGDVLKEWTTEYLKSNYYHWAIAFRENVDVPIGNIAVVSLNEKVKSAHIGYCIGKQWWRKGITSEALQAVITFLLDDVGMQRIESRHDSRNPNSGAVMKKCGMKYEGTLRKSDWNN